MLVFLDSTYDGRSRFTDIYLGIDAAEDAGDVVWIRGAGYDEIWETLGPRKTHSNPNL